MSDLLQSFGDDAPSGENLEYESVFSALEMAAQPGEERQMGDEIIAAQVPNDRDVLEKALAVLEQSHDLRAAVLMTGAELRMNGLEGLVRGTSYIRGCLEQFWETCHPQLDAEDDDDPTMRVNAVLGLGEQATMIRALRNAPMTLSTSFGRVSLRDIGVAEGEITPDPDAENQLDAAGIAAAFRDTDAALLEQLFGFATTALDDVKAIDAVFNEQLPGQGPDLAQLMKVLHRIKSRLAEESGAGLEVAVSDDDVEEGSGAAPVAAAKSTGAITSPRDVEMAIDRILKYYSEYEPSSPLPILLTRAKRLIGADFMTIVEDIAPGGIDNVRLVGGITDEE